MKFDIIVLALNDEQIRRVGAITEAPERYADPYLAIKSRILEIYQCSKWANIHNPLLQETGQSAAQLLGL